jgi:ABC-type nitrate/sulfonate/bicarbonate transport system substrate-binding protein
MIAVFAIPDRDILSSREKDIKFQPLETGKAAAAFAAGQVDAVGVFAPFTTQALKLRR